MGSAQGKETGSAMLMESGLVNSISMGNNSKAGLKFVTVPTSKTVVAKAYVSFVILTRV